MNPQRGIPIPVVSSSIERLAMRADADDLVVHFTTGTVYVYHSVPYQVFRDLIEAAKTGKSVGQAFAQKVRRQGFRFAKVGDGGDWMVDALAGRYAEPAAASRQWSPRNWFKPGFALGLFS